MMRRSYVRFATDRQAIFLKALKQIGLVTVACERAGIHRDTAYAHRTADAAFAAAWRASLASFHGRQEAVMVERRQFVDRLFAVETGAGR